MLLLMIQQVFKMLDEIHSYYIIVYRSFSSCFFQMLLAIGRIGSLLLKTKGWMKYTGKKWKDPA